MSLQISGFFQGFEIIKKWCDLKNFISRKKYDLNIYLEIKRSSFNEVNNWALRMV